MRQPMLIVLAGMAVAASAVAQPIIIPLTGGRDKPDAPAPSAPPIAPPQAGPSITSPADGPPSADDGDAPVDARPAQPPASR